MKKTFILSIAFLAIFLFGVDAIAGNISTQFDATIGGYVKLDYIHQTFHTDIPHFATLSTVTPENEDDDQSQFTARQSRLNLIVTGPESLGAKTRAFVEGDFFGAGGTNDRGNFRLRHANFTLDWEERGTQLMFGQFWDIFGPFAASTLEFGTGANIGAPNNPRIAQARVTQKVKFNEENWLTIIAGMQDPQQDDEEGPTNVAAQVMFQTKTLGASPGYWGLPMQPLTLNVFGLWGEDDATRADNPDTPQNEALSGSIDSWGVGFYTHVPVLKSSDGKSRTGTLTFEG